MYTLRFKRISIELSCQLALQISADEEWMYWFLHYWQLHSAIFTGFCQVSVQFWNKTFSKGKISSFKYSSWNIVQFTDCGKHKSFECFKLTQKMRTLYVMVFILWLNDGCWLSQIWWSYNLSTTNSILWGNF